LTVMSLFAETTGIFVRDCGRTGCPQLPHEVASFAHMALQVGQRSCDMMFKTLTHFVVGQNKLAQVDDIPRAGLTL
jgi:hypothetical protein